MTPTPPNFDRPTKYDPDHSVSDFEVSAELRRHPMTPGPAPEPSPEPRRPWWVCLLGFLLRFLLRRKGG